LLLYSSNLALGVSNWPVIYFINYTPTSSLALFITAPSTSFSGAVAGEERRLLQGEFRTHILYFVLRFAFTLFLLASFYQKPKKK
jgi:membrane protein DedA with SNARE-associated domain